MQFFEWFRERKITSVALGDNKFILQHRANTTKIIFIYLHIEDVIVLIQSRLHIYQGALHSN
jgi:hypothetical protein